MKPLILLVLLAVAAAAAAAPHKQTFTGTITDSMCGNADHAPMRMGPTDAECTVACVGVHDADYVLFDGSTAYVLSNQSALEKFAAQRVTVTGVLDPKTRRIEVDSIIVAK